ncbi:MAG: monovalent cation/H(+) antiporter subunit G [Thiohalocapsa sp.]|jgi:multicomponent Na+:H+ antiporter subunit G|uniref:monovalent cation/H(+) antiporter subunit G n=1 Tax=Thiohalocapsa sp. TaxID=2497641 RepID=UPI0025EDF015|nr:monovalent cation/H(+) antiporter subunit G [Thiohalocapsa sp.]MCG6942634.1 monovalent cation/H(+) antiporter subunit G [Thiohalocapsa sp.]
MSLADAFTAVFVSLGAFFFFAGWVGLVRFPDALSRLHALSKADNLGLGLVVIGLLPQASWPFGTLKLIALWLVAVLVGGASAQLLAGAIHAQAAETSTGGEPGRGTEAAPGANGNDKATS